VTLDEEIEQLRERWGARWQIWYVPQITRKEVVYCAKRLNGQGKVLNAYKAAHLEEYLTEAEQDTPGQA
jgi:hypothetical protein